MAFKVVSPQLKVISSPTVNSITVNTQLFLIIGTICKFYACKELSNINMFYLCTVNEKCRIVPYMNRMWTLPYMDRIWTRPYMERIWTLPYMDKYGHFHISSENGNFEMPRASAFTPV